MISIATRIELEKFQSQKPIRFCQSLSVGTLVDQINQMWAACAKIYGKQGESRVRCGEALPWNFWT